MEEKYRSIKYSTFVLILAKHWGEYWNSGIAFEYYFLNAIFENWKTGYSEFIKISPQTVHGIEGIVWYKPGLFLSQFFQSEYTVDFLCHGC
jgi:hypothetical protein